MIGMVSIIKISALLRKYLPAFVLLTIVVALIAGVLYPEVILLLKPYSTIPLFIMLYPMMITMQLGSLKGALEDKRILASSFVLNYGLSPFLGAIAAFALFGEINPQLLTGFFLKVVVPSSGMAMAWAGFANGRAETAVLVVTLSLVLSVFLVPFWAWVVLGQIIAIDMLTIFQSIAFIIVLPLIAGVITQKLIVSRVGLKRFHEIKHAFPALSSIGMYIIVFIAVGLDAPLILQNPLYIFLITIGILILYPIEFALSIVYSKVVGLDYGDAISIGFGVAAKNHSITIGLTLTLFGGLTVLPAAFAPILQIPLMLLFLRVSPRIQTWMFPSEEGVGLLQ